MEHLSGLYLCNVFPSRWILLNEYSERFYNNMDIQIYIHNIIFMKIVTMMMMTDVFLSQTSLGNLAETLLQSSFIFSLQKKTSKKKIKRKMGKKDEIHPDRNLMNGSLLSFTSIHLSQLSLFCTKKYDYTFLYETGEKELNYLSQSGKKKPIRFYISVRNGQKI